MVNASGNGCDATISDVVSVSVVPDPLIFVSADDDEFCDGGLTTIHSEVTGGAGGNNYQWQQWNGTLWTNIPGANGGDYTTPALATGTYSYRLVVTQDTGCEGASSPQVIVVNTDPLVFATADDIDFCNGGSTTLHSEVIGGAGGNNYQWQSLVAGNWENLSQGNLADYTTVAIATGTYTYRLVVT